MPLNNKTNKTNKQKQTWNAVHKKKSKIFQIIRINEPDMQDTAGEIGTRS